MADLKIDRLPAPTQLDEASHFGDRRKEARSKLQNGLKVQVSVPPAEGTFEGELTDVAPSGVAIIVPAALRRGTIITFRCGTQRVYARVANCRAGTGGYRIGVKINDAVEEPE